jgi:putative phage-type endonuclease
MTIEYYYDVIQGSEEWLALRCGLLTASEMKLVVTPTLKIANNDKTRSHVYELAAQRITGYVEPSYISDDMLRGMDDEHRAKEVYKKHYSPIKEVGFVVNKIKWVTMGCSPDGLVGDDGIIECKSRRQKYQLETIANDEVPSEYIIQIQTILMITERKWCDFVSYSGGMPMFVKRVEANKEIQDAIIQAAMDFEDKVTEVNGKYIRNSINFQGTERYIEKEITI